MNNSTMDEQSGDLGASASVPSATAVRHAKAALREPIYRRVDDNIDRAVASAIYRQNNSEIARCFLRLIAATSDAPNNNPGGIGD